MSEVYSVLVQNILPILIVTGFGFVLRRWSSVEPRSLSTAVLNVFSPALVFSSLTNSNVATGELGELALFAILSISLMGLIGLTIAPLLRLTRVETATLLILIMFVNSGNYGLTLVQLRHGDEGLSRAVIYYVTSTILIYTLGIFIASAGRATWRVAVMKLARLPAVYAALLAVLVFTFDLQIPAPITAAIKIAGAGAIPVMLLVLGMQLADLRGGLNVRLAIPAISLRLLVGPLVGMLIAAFIGLKGLSRSAAIIEASMPSAVFSIILATEFQLPAPAVTSIVVLSTLLSPLTIAATIAVLGL